MSDKKTKFTIEKSSCYALVKMALASYSGSCVENIFSSYSISLIHPGSMKDVELQRVKLTTKCNVLSSTTIQNVVGLCPFIKKVKALLPVQNFVKFKVYGKNKYLTFLSSVLFFCNHLSPEISCRTSDQAQTRISSGKVIHRLGVVDIAGPTIQSFGEY